MKKPDFKIKPEALIGVGLGLLSIAQMVLTNKKEAGERAALKAEIIEEVTKDLTTKQG